MRRAWLDNRQLTQISYIIPGLWPRHVLCRAKTRPAAQTTHVVIYFTLFLLQCKISQFWQRFTSLSCLMKDLIRTLHYWNGKLPPSPTSTLPIIVQHCFTSMSQSLSLLLRSQRSCHGWNLWYDSQAQTHADAAHYAHIHTVSAQCLQYQNLF